MNLLIPDIWLRDFLKTKATPKEIAGCLSLCGPSVEKISGKGNDLVYSVEVTTNRIDSACIYGIAREAAAILPMFKIRAALTPVKISAKPSFATTVDYLAAEVDRNLCPRFAAVLIQNVKIQPSPQWVQKRLSLSGIRPINNIVDISNFIMLEVGQPTHTFDYDKIKGQQMTLRESVKGEKITTLDSKSFVLPGGDIVIEDGSGTLIDLAGVMGGLNSAIDETTKNVLFFVQTYSPVNIRRTSMTLAQRTQAAVLFEKGLDPENVALAMGRGIDLFASLADGKAQKSILDIYPNPVKTKKITVDLPFVEKRLGIAIPKPVIRKILTSLGFKIQGVGKNLRISVPSFRAKDINIKEDIVEEIARMYGYQNLPSALMTGQIPDPLPGTTFDFEQKIKNLLRGFGSEEIYTSSLVSQEQAGTGALKLQNPLGKESEYLRTSLIPSLVWAAGENSGEKDTFALFEMANVYLPRKAELPEERLMVGEIFVNTDFREAKGTTEALLTQLHIKADLVTQDGQGFLAGHRLSIKIGNEEIGQFGVLEDNNLIYAELEVLKLKRASREFLPYRPSAEFPAQIEDITLTFPPKTRLGEVISSISNREAGYSFQFPISKVELKDIYKDSYTFRIWYQDPKKTLTDAEVAAIRNKILKTIKIKFGGVVKN